MPSGGSDYQAVQSAAWGTWPGSGTTGHLAGVWLETVMKGENHRIC